MTCMTPAKDEEEVKIIEKKGRKLQFYSKCGNLNLSAERGQSPQFEYRHVAYSPSIAVLS